jgi:hypothetical protein
VSAASEESRVEKEKRIDLITFGVYDDVGCVEREEVKVGDALALELN